MMAFLLQSQSLLFVWLFGLLVFLKFFVLFIELVPESFQFCGFLGKLMPSLFNQLFQHFMIETVSDGFMLYELLVGLLFKLFCQLFLILESLQLCLIFWDFFLEFRSHFLFFRLDNIIELLIELQNQVLHFRLLFFSQFFISLYFLQVKRNFILVFELIILILIKFKFEWLKLFLHWFFLLLNFWKLGVELLKQPLTYSEVFNPLCFFEFWFVCKKRLFGCIWLVFFVMRR